MIAASFDSFLLDLDGVLFCGDRPIEGAGETVSRLRAMGKGLAFVTNNSARTPAQVVAHLASVGVDARVDEVETSALSTAELLAGRGVGSAFVIGEDGLRTALRDAGVDVVTEAGPVDAVVVGWDRGVDYDALRSAAAHLQRGAVFVASNPDTSYPAPDGLRWPGAGAIVAALVATTELEPEIVGKPYAPILEAALRRAGGGSPLVVGDRLDTDIEGAHRLGWSSMLVLTGISSREDLRAAQISPTHVAEDVRGLVAP